MYPLKGNQTTVFSKGQELRTLRDILPVTPGLHVLFVAKTPAPRSVEAGHYFQGRHGTSFWNKLKTNGLLAPTTEFEDDSLLEHGYGLTDIVKVPHAYREEPSDQEYLDGLPRILELVRDKTHQVVFLQTQAELDHGLSSQQLELSSLPKSLSCVHCSYRCEKVHSCRTLFPCALASDFFRFVSGPEWPRQ